MAVWVIKGGRTGEHEDAFLEKGVVSLGFGLQQSIADFADRDALRAVVENRNGADQMWRFYDEVGTGDLVVLPRKRTRQVAVGRFNSPYAYRPEAVSSGAPHVRGVEWQATDIPRSHFDQDLLYSFGALQTFSQPRRAPDAEARIEHIAGAYLGLASSSEPGPAEIPPVGSSVSDGASSVDFEDETDLNLKIRDRIIAIIRGKYPGVELERLVAAVLEASGYTVLQTRRGADGGIDVVAGSGELGFGQPRLCVQVKSGRSLVDLPDYNRLQGNVRSFGADHGLLVSLSGFTRAVHNENERSFFEIRLWDADALVQRLLEVYGNLPLEIRRDIPLENRLMPVDMTPSF